ncbi:HD-GYP domain-containing protein [Paenibacillus alvei]|uniref:HD-GYP domain-containing protein n=1 Tax=Paenibacillus TaxID=44249 RepID=UPI0002899F4F|nr:HD-GYP domain-containing protein [Paenibacillus alvei]EJW14652.1 metal dependent phosphohydrolase [Paenibacillus alvei DSM 29]MCY7486097.1 HD-GYP domain-containing protein [Paenibacillus alvei]MCY9542730.1 HD-GYP domain-containing protein [Paenibacillus alvei]MCY9708042.1 HD-GYP domain-containing protein [Paenibacillus alvei]MCY9733864.1 HD-GYP domain-containing protein [Paenibacillus alvei]
MRIHVTEIQEGDILSKDIFNDNGLLVLSAGTVMKQRDIALLIRHHLEMINIEGRACTEPAVESPYSTNEGQQTYHSAHQGMQNSYNTAIHNVEKIFQDVVQHGFVQDELVQESITPLIQQMEKQHDVVSLLLLLDSKDDYTYQHSVQVGMLSYYIAKWMHYGEEEAIRICKAGFLHDIGKSQIDRHLLHKPEMLTFSEFEQMKSHTVLGYEIIRAAYDDEWLAVAALQHHERIDGSGYPYGTSDLEIHPVARIIAVADIYSAMTSTRIYRSKQDLFTVLKELHTLSYTGLDPKIVHTFIRHMLPNFVHKQARLSDGRTGTIIMNHHTEFFRPLVQVDNQFIDLTQFRNLHIEKVYM